jgi:outer membrane protein OmpA-like peptidoglycan-associated protein
MIVTNILRTGLAIAILFISSMTCSQDLSKLKDNKCYVVVGAFSLEKNAEAFANGMVPQGYNAQYKYNSYRKMYYVYTFDAINRELTKKELFSLREKLSEITGSWLYAGNFKGPHITAEEWAAMLAEPKADIVEAEQAVEQVQELVVSEVKEPEVKEEPIIEEPGTFKVYINTTNASNQREVKGDFKVIDMERNKELSPVKSHELLRIMPKNGTNRLKFVSNTIGYKLTELTIDLDEPLEETNSNVEVSGDSIIIDFEMSKYQKGEFAVLWQVFFFRDAAIMKEESVYELNQLLRMMNEDDKMRIKIHGHTNGKSHGKVLHLDMDDKQFFSLNGSHNEDIASAKKLSEYRAYTIQHWLMDQGVAEERMEIVGWGGKKMLHDKHDDKAHQNVRVEIEVLETS